MRVACLLVPDLPWRSELRAHPDPACSRDAAAPERPDGGAPALPVLVVADAEGGSPGRVLAASPAARAAGVAPPCSLPRARAACPEARVRLLSLAAEGAARQALLDAALSCSPRAALAPRAAGVFAAEGAVFADARGVGALFRSEAGFATALAARAASLGLPGAVCVASSRTAALLAARALSRASHAANDETAVRVIPPGEEAAFLAPLPLDLLDPDDCLAQQLTRLGVRTVRDLLRLPPRSAAQRLGPEGMRLLRRARGEEVEPPLRAPAARHLREAADLEAPAEHLEPLRFVLHALIARLCERLSLRGLACGALDLELGLEGSGCDVRRVAPSAPTVDVRVLGRIVGLALEERPPRAPVLAACVSTDGRRPRRDQLDLFRPAGPDPTALDRTLAELEARCGAGRVGAPAVPDDHRPDAFALRPFRPRPWQPGSGTQDAPETRWAPLAVRALRPPVAARVRVRRGRPVWIESAVARGAVVEAAGPWRTTGGWWREDRYALDHYDVQMGDGTVLRLVFDFVERSWRVDGLYD